MQIYALRISFVVKEEFSAEREIVTVAAIGHALESISYP